MFLIMVWVYQSPLELGYKPPVVNENMNNSLDMTRVSEAISIQRAGNENVNNMNLARAVDSMNNIARAADSVNNMARSTESNMARAAESINSLARAAENMQNRTTESMNMRTGEMNIGRSAEMNAMNMSRANDMNIARGGHLFQDDMEDMVKRPQPSDTPKVKVSKSVIPACMHDNVEEYQHRSFDDKEANSYFIIVKQILPSVIWTNSYLMRYFQIYLLFKTYVCETYFVT